MLMGSDGGCHPTTDRRFITGNAERRKGCRQSHQQWNCFEENAEELCL